MPQTKPREGSPKNVRYRRVPQRDGMKLIRLWVPDPARPDFIEEAARQAAILRGAPEEAEALDFIESAFDWPEP
ncbi:antitoxin MazE family protein [Methylobacterium sp. E-005]|uniref:antitoxin MazE-like protein n=1 Tax=Methylobacterium sp. E-005 TaxID=2836549 RepID=UPI001FB8B9D3|nr:antitoxin MazE-like protein [Methylobacterium sp. E-005]MCJ2089828.1 antitoxin MazE family protein [Methylobacterium sp. E-005]